MHEKKQSGGKLLAHPDLPGGGEERKGVSRGNIAQHTKRDENRYLDGSLGGGMWVFGLDWAGPG